jgi:VIT1/CCC1 family predicted Fe2+/Mn2+ transporter
MAAAGVFLLVFLSTFPVVLPFVFMGDVKQALRVSQGIAMVMMFGAGWQLGRHAGRPAWRTGLVMVGVGMAFAVFAFVMGG